MITPPVRVFTDAEIAERLSVLPRWRLEGGALHRTFRTASFKATLMLVTTIGHLCEAAWHHPEMVVGFDTLRVKLSTHKPPGITEKDFALAARIDAVVDWRPAEDDPFTGPPADPRHAYLRDA